MTSIDTSTQQLAGPVALPADIPPTASLFQPTALDVADLGMHYGLPVFAWGEDGDVATLGHVPARTAIEAANRAWRTAWGERLRLFPHAALPNITRGLALFTRDMDDPSDEWVWAALEGTPGAVAVTIVCGQEGLFEPAPWGNA